MQHIQYCWINHNTSSAILSCKENCFWKQKKFHDYFLLYHVVAAAMNTFADYERDLNILWNKSAQLFGYSWYLEFTYSKNNSKSLKNEETTHRQQSSQKSLTASFHFQMETLWKPHKNTQTDNNGKHIKYDLIKNSVFIFEYMKTKFFCKAKATSVIL